MIYVSEETRKDTRNRRQRKGIAEHLIVLRDTNDALFRLESRWRDLPFAMKSAGIKLDDVCGLAKSGYQTVLVTPVTGVEIAVLKCLSNPRITLRHSNVDEICDSYFKYGWYNIAITGGACSVARLILERCPGDVNTIGGRIECGQNIVSICVDEHIGVVKYLTFDLHDFQTFNRIRAKKNILDIPLSYYESFPIEWKEVSEGDVHPRCRVVRL